jgi:hypothetical protein
MKDSSGKDAKFYIKTFEEVRFPTDKEYINVEITFDDSALSKRIDKIKGSHVNEIFFELANKIGMKKIKNKKMFKKNFSYILNNAWLRTIIEEKAGTKWLMVYKDSVHVDRELSGGEKMITLFKRMTQWYIKKIIRLKLRPNKSMIKAVKTTLGQIIKVNLNNISNPRELVIFEFYLLSLHKAIDLLESIRLLDKKGQYRNELILSRTLLDLNFRFLYLIDKGDDFILDFMLKTGVNNLKIRLKDKFKNIEELFENEFNDLDTRGNKFKYLEQVARELKKEKYYNHFFSLYSRFAHTNSLVKDSYLNDFKEFKKYYNNEAGDHYKNNRQYYVLSNIFFYEIGNAVFDFMAENNYVPSRNFLNRDFLNQLQKEERRWTKINKYMEEEVGFPY